MVQAAIHFFWKAPFGGASSIPEDEEEEGPPEFADCPILFPVSVTGGTFGSCWKLVPSGCWAVVCSGRPFHGILVREEVLLGGGVSWVEERQVLKSSSEVG